MQNKTNNAFFNLLFNKDESTCFSSSAKGVKVYKLTQETMNNNANEFFCVNPLSLDLDQSPTKDWHDAKVGRRADCNVTTFRNILIEIDSPDFPLKRQVEFIKESGLPFSTAVYSGSKSVHFIVSLEESLNTKEEYRAMFKRIWIALGKIPDRACGNTSRLTRYPNGYRTEKNKMQTLLHVGTRVSNQALEAWLVSKGVPADHKEVQTIARDFNLERPEFFFHSKLRFATKKFLLNGAPEGEWNISLFSAVCDLVNNSANYDTIVAEVLNITGHLDEKDYSTIQSAYERSNAEQTTTGDRV